VNINAVCLELINCVIDSWLSIVTLVVEMIKRLYTENCLPLLMVDNGECSLREDVDEAHYRPVWTLLVYNAHSHSCDAKYSNDGTASACHILQEVKARC